MGGSASQLPSLSVSGQSFNRPGGSAIGPRPKRPLGLPASSAAFNSRRAGNADAKEDKHTALITIDDLQRLREQCSIGGARSEMETDYEQRYKEKKELQEKSRQRVKNWSNTIENMRNTRIEEKYQKLEQAELERRRVDAEEDAFNQEKRKIAIEVANKKMHDGQDQVKAFHSKLFLSDVLLEREAQLEIVKRRQEQDKAVEEGWVDNDRLKMEEYDTRMNSRMEQMFKRKQDTAKVVREQLHEFKISHIKRMKEEMLEEELIKRKAKEDLEMEKRKDFERRAR